MRLSELKPLQPGARIKHKRYGICELREVKYVFGELFGVVVRPNNTEGKALLAADSGTDIPDMLEDSLRRLTLES